MSPPPTSQETIESALADAIAARTGRRPVATDSIGSLGIDSVDLANLVGDLERRFGFRADETIFDVTTVGELAAYIRARLGESRPRGAGRDSLRGRPRAFTLRLSL